MTEPPKSKIRNYSTGIGIMSGTSLDGIDLALCKFSNSYTFDLLNFKTVSYSHKWKKKLESAHHLSGIELRLLEIEYSRYTASFVLELLKETGQNVDFIACHGHTIFHQPENNLTYQMIDGSILAALSGITTVCDFRSGDVALGGQGAPLVPIGDALLFGEYEACLNLGGFANMSYEEAGKRIAYDISPANLLLNELASREGLDYDKNGDLARSGKIIMPLLEKLNSLEFYGAQPPKSLGREWLEEKILPFIKMGTTRDLLATAVAHISDQISHSLNQSAASGKVLVTGGGAHNTYLMECISQKSNLKIEIPSAKIIDAKEAIVFALLGKLRLENKTNILSSVTGASHDSCGGAVHH
ncbi:anhydro-N-acetylmuramic acid kinase [Cryomorpha ignava]|nr:anhydro-N-acetylmuramic acid kinase [Cryomorpha ignava]